MPINRFPRIVMALRLLTLLVDFLLLTLTHFKMIQQNSPRFNKTAFLLLVMWLFDLYMGFKRSYFSTKERWWLSRERILFEVWMQAPLENPLYGPTWKILLDDLITSYYTKDLYQLGQQQHTWCFSNGDFFYELIIALTILIKTLGCNEISLAAFATI